MKNTIFGIIIIFLLVAVLVVQFSFLAGLPGSTVSPEKIRQLAAKLESEELYQQSIDTYRQYLHASSIPPELRANILYRIGTIYLEELHDYENALATFIQITDLYPASPIVREAEERMMRCYELLNRSFDAQQKLKKLTDLDPEEEGGGPVVAVIGDRKIHLDTIEREIDQMPEPVQQQFTDPEKKLEFVKSKVFQELLYEMALRKELNKQDSIRQRIHDFEKQLLANEVYKQEVREPVEITQNDLQLYYKANPEEFTQPASARIAHIEVETKDKAQEVRKKLEEGVSFTQAVSEYSQNAISKAKEGLLGLIRADQPVIPGLGRAPQIAEEIMQLDEGAMSEPKERNSKYHIFKIIEKTPETQPPFEQVKTQVEHRVRQMKEQEKQQKLMDKLLNAENVKIYEHAVLANTAKKTK